MLTVYKPQIPKCQTGDYLYFLSYSEGFFVYLLLTILPLVCKEKKKKDANLFLSYNFTTHLTLTLQAEVYISTNNYAISQDSCLQNYN